MKPSYSIPCIVALSIALGFSAQLQAAVPFASCPSQAFMVQNPSGTPVAYGISLDVGSYSTLSWKVGDGKINGIGYNVHDDYIYGWDYGAQTLTQIGSDFISTPLSVSNLQVGPTSFYVGDVSTIENSWYGYRVNKGFFRIDLDTLEMTKVASSATVGNLRILDMAFHPDDGIIYSVDNYGYLYKIDPSTGSGTKLNQVINSNSVGHSLSFGAQYFDVDGNLYLSNNGNGYIYIVSIDDLNSSSAFFAYGPSSNSNDGARCAFAPVGQNENSDFGDAPDTYGTLYDSFGARHAISGLKLGALVDGESEAYAYPLSDDTSDLSNDDDGISFPVPLEIEETSFIYAEVDGADGEGVLSAWIDWDQDGEFNDDEIILNSEWVDDGQNQLYFEVPSWALSGDTWARFRLSHSYDIGPNGGVSAGEVEDYQVTVTDQGVSVELYPAGSGYTTFAYEDLWSFTESGEDDGCNMFRTESGCGTDYRPSWSLIIPLETPIPQAQMPDFPYDPFIFATPGYYYGEYGLQVSGGHPGRNVEVHLKNQMPTSKFNNGYIGKSDDATNTGNGTYFHTSNGLPWAIEIPLDWKHPIESVSILEAYPQFADFAQDATGQTAPDWYVNPTASSIYID
ncbi:LruC domain-containing protein [Aliivibrio salmonicida]|uniref:Exported protein n=1 Tax=Aliivibrio salmonicida (strain LFI1238) TaxID=316275 RepID=B6EQM6_ALISL|nr:LruC domain-containing protein [Aliivibrio salmonicida]AZL86429.1 LruC domain-containing protein [Aliivibrio salmonicida]CAQ81003.1 putative exported protein [Aliivibrio salmonicida LFI1238]